MKTHKDLDLWKDSIDFVLLIYRISANFPNTEKFGLASQIRNAAVSVPANISEGAARRQSKDFIRFLRISFGSLSEVETLLIIAFGLDYINESLFNELKGKINKISAQLSGLITAISKKIQTD